jgi:hypothetical protein
MTHRIGFLLALAATILSMASDIEKKENVKSNPSTMVISHFR